MLIAMAIGVTAIIMLTALGEAARTYVTQEFVSLGSQLIIVLPGRSETSGNAPSLFIGDTPRDLTLDDANSLYKISGIKRVAPVILGSATVSRNARDREVAVFGTSHEYLEIRHWTMTHGRFLPSDRHSDRAVCILGVRVAKEMFPLGNALGSWLRIGDRRFRVLGILASEGQSLGIDTKDIAIIPVAAAEDIFNTSSLFRILVESNHREIIPTVSNEIRKLLTQRHQGEEDITIVTQDAVLNTFDKIFLALSLTLAGIGAISVTVAGVLIMNIMLVAVSQRTPEIGLLKALGASQRQIEWLFVTEASLLSLGGASLGIAVGVFANTLISLSVEDFNLIAPIWSYFIATFVALMVGVSFGLLPAYRAARLDAVQALAHK